MQSCLAAFCSLSDDIEAGFSRRVAEIEFAAWTPDQRLRHASFVCLREDKSARRVVRET
jgi:ATP-dependent DNA ligase